MIAKMRFSNTEQGWSDFLKKEDDIDSVIIEAGSVSERTLRYLEDLNVQVKMVHPKKARLIAEATIKTDELDAKRLIDLEKVGVLPEVWIPPREIRDVRHLCRYRYFLVQIRTKIKNRIHFELDREDLNVERLTYEYLETVRDRTIMIDQLYRLLKETNEKIREVEKEIEKKYSENEYSKIIDTVPGISKYGSLLLAMEIGDINRFAN
ncbi:MAG: IS110 family transposase [Thermoplasmata archaeon]